MQSAGKYIVILGGLIILVGIFVMFFGNKLNWLGNLPGDIKIEREYFKFYFPVTTMILLSIVLTIALWIIRKFLN